jgi:hypothetical protein
MYYTSKPEYQTFNAQGRFTGTVVGFDLACETAGEGGTIIREDTSFNQTTWNIVNGQPVKE